jgi:hypothetical protein
MNAIFSNARGILVSAGILLVMLIVLFGVLHAVEKFAPAPLSTAANWASDHASASGWS